MKLFELIDKLDRLRKDIGNEALKTDITGIFVEENDTLVLKFGYDIIVPDKEKPA